ncbi:MAG TPA: PKD domain-containing protein [Sandaracinaceae bacterium LLY-WYZ-13_1]|nr:PKD domain-containing protein [Sandaracinaceae bacterium LLY-WYZ-13_1]
MRSRVGSRRAILALLGLIVGACDGEAGLDGGPATDASTSDAARDAGSDAGPALVADAGPSFYALVGEEVVLDGSGSLGATTFEWSFGDGRGWDGPRGEPMARVTYDAPGRYRAVLEVRDAIGRRRTDQVLVTVTHAPSHTPRQSSSVAVWGERVAVVSPDSDELAIFSFAGGAFELVDRVETAAEPRTVTVWNGRWAVVCQAGAEVRLHDADGAAAGAVALPPASRPYGAVALDGALFVSLQATGELARMEGDALAARVPAIADARGVAALPDGRLAVTRWRSRDDEGQLAVLAPDGTEREIWSLAYDPQPGSDTESGGVPSYLEQLAVAPTGRLAVVPSLQAAIGEGLFRSPRALTHETTVRASVSFLDPRDGAEDFDRRKLWDDRGLAAAAAFSSRGDYLFLAMRGSRAVERFDVLSRTQAGTILEVGLAPQGLALSGDDRWLFVDAYLSRELVVYDVSDPSALPSEAARLPIPSSEPLDETILRGKILFNDAADPRLGRDSYIACAHCHLEGMGDHRTWDFTDRGEGLRNTIDLLGRAGVGHGALHWSANFDEVQDFEHDLRGPFRGTGLMDDEDFHAGTRDETLGDPKAGVSEDLDALAAYVSSLDEHLPSPFRDADGSLPEAAARGRRVFADAGCGTCHAGDALTDSGFEGDGTPRLHDVGTLAEGSGERLGGPLVGIDTPTLHGLWQGAPYLHDGSAATLREVFTTRNEGDAHGATSGLSAGELDDLIAYLRCLDGRVD